MPCAIFQLVDASYHHLQSFEYEEKFNIMSYILFLRVQVYSAGCVLAKIRAYSFIYALHASFIGDFSANVLSAALQSCPTIKCVCLYADPSANLLTSGPYGLIFASFVPFYFDIPVSTRFHIFSNHFSDKSFIYLAGVQVKENTCTFLCVNVFASPPPPFWFWFRFLPHLPLHFSFQYQRSNISFGSAASFIILEKINLAWDMWYPCWFLVSSKSLWHPQGKGRFFGFTSYFL